MPKLSLIVLILGICLPNAGIAAPVMVAKPNANVTVRIFTTPCENPKVTQFLQDDAVQFFHAGKSIIRGQELDLCWRFVPQEDAVFIVDERRVAGALPKDAFVKEEMM